MLTDPTTRAAAVVDPMAPRGDAAAALAGPLSAVTLVSADPQRATQFFIDAMRMRRVDSGADPSPAAMAAQCRLWGAPEHGAWSEIRLQGPAAAPGLGVRIVAAGEGQPIRPGLDAHLHGGLSIGYPVADMEASFARIRALGVGTTAGIVPLEMTRADGSRYVSGEIHFRGPDDIYVLAVGRPSDLAPVGPIDAAAGLGGPAYSAMVVGDAGREIAFYRDTLGWEARRDTVLTSSGPGGGLGLAPGTRFRFAQLFAPGASSGYIVLLDMLELGRANPVAPRFPNRGLVAWTFPTRRFDELERRVRAGIGGARLLAGPLDPAAQNESPTDPRRRVLVGGRRMSIASPAGLTLEIVEEGGRSA